MSSTSSTYLLSVGDKGKERLDILNKLFADTSHALLLKAGLEKNQHVLEIGCGTGEMTCWIAEQVGKDGHVYAVDISADQLEIAKANAMNKNLKNITFINKSVFDLQNFPLMDVIYSRFILMHLVKAFDALAILKKCLKENGRIVCEEATNSVVCCYPPSPIFQKHREFLMAISKKTELDYNLGEKLYLYFKKLNLKNIYVNFVQPIYQNHYQKKMIVLLVNEVKKNYIKYNIATEDEINQLLIQLEEFINDESYLVSFARTTQIFATK